MEAHTHHIRKKKHPLLHLWDKTFIFMTINLFMKKTKTFTVMTFYFINLTLFPQSISWAE